MEEEYSLRRLSRTYRALEGDKRKKLKVNWNSLIHYLEETDDSWVKKSDMRQELGMPGNEFEELYDAFQKLFDPQEGTGNTFAFYQMDLDYIKCAGRDLGLKTDEKEKSRIKTDDLLQTEAEYEQRID